jgi:glycosyltransferase involved in cell wall biosynthesis
MKILIATESFYPNISGVAVFSYNLAHEMALAGHEVFVVAPSPKLIPFIEDRGGIKIFRLASRKNPFRKGYYISKSPFLSVKKIVNEIRPDVIHLQDPAAISLSALIAARRLKIPVVVTNHFALDYVTSYLPWAKPIHPLIHTVLNAYLGWIYNRAQVLTCPSQMIANHFIKRNLKSQPIVISNGVDLGRFMPFYGDRASALRDWQVPKNEPIILYVGRLDVDKQTGLLIKTMALVVKKVQCHLILIGEGKEIDDLKKMVKDLQIENHVTFTGFISNDSDLLPRIYQNATVFTNPCSIEAQGISVLEALATGLPIVAANGGALPELIKNNQNGYLFEPGNVEDLAAKLIKILTDQNLAKKMGEKSLEIVESHMFENTFNRFEEIYSKLAKK